MNDKVLKHRVNQVAFDLMKTKGVIAPVDVLMGIGVLSKTDYEHWRRGGYDFLERACKINLRKLSTVNREMWAFAKKNNLKASWTYYKKWSSGKIKNKSASPVKLRFSKSGDENIERNYATHFISQQTLDALKERRQQAENQSAETAITSDNTE
jgi:hypothetical protein